MPGPTCRKNDCDLCKSTFNEVMTKHLGMRAYHITRGLQLDLVDEVNRVNYGNDFRAFMLANPDIKWIWTDESSFNLNGNVAYNTMVRYSTDREGRPEHFEFTNMKNKTSVSGLFGFMDDGTKLPPIKLPGDMDRFQYLA